MAALIKIDHSSTSAAGRVNAIRFCSRCGELADEPLRSNGGIPRTRVCTACGMGMLLSCARDALPGAGAAFLIVTSELRVSAVSEAAEMVFGPEHVLVGANIRELLTSPLGDDRLVRTITQAAIKAREPATLPVRGLGGNAGGAGMMAARISTCGRPRAALVTVEPSAFGRR